MEPLAKSIAPLKLAPCRLAYSSSRETEQLAASQFGSVFYRNLGSPHAEIGIHTSTRAIFIVIIDGRAPQEAGPNSSRMVDVKFIRPQRRFRHKRMRHQLDSTKRRNQGTDIHPEIRLRNRDIQVRIETRDVVDNVQGAVTAERNALVGGTLNVTREDRQEEVLQLRPIRRSAGGCNVGDDLPVNTVHGMERFAVDRADVLDTPNERTFDILGMELSRIRHRSSFTRTRPKVDCLSRARDIPRIAENLHEVEAREALVCNRNWTAGTFFVAGANTLEVIGRRNSVDG